MKAILTFNLPEEESDFRLAVNGRDWYCAMWDIDNKIRSWLKYGHEFKSADEALEAARDLIYDEIRDRNLAFE